MLICCVSKLTFFKSKNLLSDFREISCHNNIPYYESIFEEFIFVKKNIILFSIFSLSNVVVCIYAYHLLIENNRFIELVSLSVNHHLLAIDEQIFSRASIWPIWGALLSSIFSFVFILKSHSRERVKMITQLAKVLRYPVDLPVSFYSLMMHSKWITNKEDATYFIENRFSHPVAFFDFKSNLLWANSNFFDLWKVSPGVSGKRKMNWSYFTKELILQEGDIRDFHSLIIKKDIVSFKVIHNFEKKLFNVIIINESSGHNGYCIQFIPQISDEKLGQVA